MPGFTFTETQNTRPRVLRKGFLFVGVAANPSVETNVDLALLSTTWVKSKIQKSSHPVQDQT